MIRALITHFRGYRDILRHPLNQGRFWKASIRWLRWQIGSRLAPGPTAVDFVGETVLLLETGMRGATHNHYCGLAELADMGFLLHALRAGDLFLDVGANVGAYSVLAGAAGANVIAIEALPQTAEKLGRNIRLNDLSARVEIVCAAAGEAPGELRFSTGQGTMNHVVAGQHGEESCIVPVRRLDEILAGRTVQLLKLDVEGYEVPALRGAPALLADPGLMAVVIELNGSGDRYGFTDREVAETLQTHGFRPMRYDPLSRRLDDNDEASPDGNNVVFVRDVAAIRERLIAAPLYRLGNGRCI